MPPSERPAVQNRCFLANVLLAVASAVVASQASAEDARSQQFRRQVVLQAAAADEMADDRLVRVTLDADLYDATEPSLANLRVEHERGASVPFLVQEARGSETRTVRSTWQPKSTAAQPETVDGSDRLLVTLTLDEKAAVPTGLRIVTPLKNFEQTVLVESSADGEAWVPCGEAGLIFDYSQFIDIRNDELRLPATEHRFFRLTITEPTLEQESQLLEISRRLQGDREASRDERTRVERVPFRIDRVEFWAEAAESIASTPLTQVYSPQEVAEHEEDQTQQTVVEISMRREPLTSLTLVTSSRNFSRRVEVQASDDASEGSWKKLAETTLASINFQGFQRESLKVAFPETRSRQYRLVIDNRDGTPLEVTGVLAEGRVHTVVFLAEPQQRYSLVYGDDVTQQSSHDTAVLTELLAKGFVPEEAGLSEPVAEASDPPPATPWWQRFANRWVLTAVAALLVAALGWGLVQAAKRVDGVADEAATGHFDQQASGGGGTPGSVRGGE